MVPEKSDGDGVGGKRWRREKAEEPEKAAEAKRWRYQRKAPEKGDGREAGKEETGPSASPGRAKALRKQVGERSERDFASAMGASATQKRSLRNATPDCAAPTVEEYGSGR